MLEEITALPRKFIRNIDSVSGPLAVYLVQDFNLTLLKRLVNFGLNAFGDLAMDEFGLVPQIRHGNVYVLKQVDKPTVIGLAILMRDWEDEHTVYLSDFAVHDDYSGHGLGYEFLKIIAQTLVEQGFTTMGLTVDTSNAPAIHLYQEKLGFKTVDFRQNEYGPNQDRYYMQWDMQNFLSD